MAQKKLKKEDLMEKAAFSLDYTKDFLNKEEVSMEDILDGLSMERLTRDMAKALSGKNNDFSAIREVYTQFQRIQQDRIKTGNRIFAQENINGGSEYILNYIFRQFTLIESELKMILELSAKNHPIGQWLMSIKGIGPILAAAWMSSLDIKKVNTAGGFQSYCGLNDYNKPRYNISQATAIVNEAIANNPTDDGTISSDAIVDIYRKTLRSVKYLLEYGSSPIEEGSDIKVLSKEKLITALLRVPYNPDLKTLCFKTSDNFIKVMNRGSLYGELYLSRKAYENAKNEAGDYADQAKTILANKKFAKGTDAYKAYSQGMLPKIHIDRRCRRYAMKIFVSHLFEALYVYTYRKPAPRPYAMVYMEHNDYIAPEVDYREFGIVPDEGAAVDPRFANKISEKEKNKYIANQFKQSKVINKKPSKDALMSEVEDCFMTWEPCEE